MVHSRMQNNENIPTHLGMNLKKKKKEKKKKKLVTLTCSSHPSP